MSKRTLVPGAFAIAIGLLSGFGASAADHRVTMANSTYGPALVQAKVGDVLVFDNDDDDTSHVVFVPTVGHGVDLGTQKSGEQRRMTLRRPGRFEVECVLHEHMKMTVEVDR